MMGGQAARGGRIVIPEGGQFDPDKPVDDWYWSSPCGYSCGCSYGEDKFQDLDFYENVDEYEYSSALRVVKGH